MCAVVCVCVSLHERLVYVLCCVACMSIFLYICDRFVMVARNVYVTLNAYKMESVALLKTV